MKHANRPQRTSFGEQKVPPIVPSQVVDLIDLHYPLAKTNEPGGDLPPAQAGRLQAILAMIEKIPAELLDLPAREYGGLLEARNDIQYVVATNLNRGGLHYFSWRSVKTLRWVLGMCPDEFPPATSTDDLAFIVDDDLRASVRSDIGAAERAFSNTEWKAATVLAGSAIEALLLWAITEGPSANFAGAFAGASAAGTKPHQTDANRWDLAQFISGAEALKIINKDTIQAVSLAREFRNLIHPGRAARLGKICDRGTAHSALGALHHVVRDLS